MSMIMPAGINKINWSPKKDASKVVKTASTEVNEEVKEQETDALAEAALSFLGKKTAEDDCEACGKVVSEDEIVTEDAPVEDVAVEDVAVEEDSVKEDSVDNMEVSETEDSDTVVESIEVAVETAKDALEEVEVAIEDLKTDDGEAEVSEVEIDIPGVVDSEDEVEIEIVEDEECEDEGEETFNFDETAEIEKESKTVTMSDEDEPTVAGSSEEFCKFAKLSPQNRNKLADYWVNMLGYPKDYVSLLTKDYEK